MLVLTHGTLRSHAMRQLYQVLHEMGPGREVCAGVAVLGDGFDRLGPISGLAILPAGVAVLAAHEIDGAPGYLYAPTRGAWTIGGRQAQVLGAGSSPVAGLDSAVKSTVAQIRRGGINPGDVQALVAVTGPVSGVAQPEPERGDGLVVSTLDVNDICAALQLATRPRYGGVNQSWTSADIRSVLDILGYQLTSVDDAQLGAEGFTYSPYVLRPTAIDDLPFSGRQSASAPGFRGVPAYSSSPATTDPGQRTTGPIPAVTPPVPAAVGDADLLGSLAATDSGSAAGQAAAAADGGSGRRAPIRWLIPLAALLVVALVVWFGARALLGGDGDSAAAQSSVSAAQSTGEGPASSPSSKAQVASQKVGDYTFTRDAHDAVTNCAAHANGAIKALLVESPCEGMERALFSTSVDGAPVAITVAIVTMPDAQSAATLKSQVDTDGTGNVNDLLREQAPVPEGYPSPEVLDGGEYASSIDGSQVHIVQAAYVDGSPTDPAVDSAAKAALSLVIVK